MGSIFTAENKKYTETKKREQNGFGEFHFKVENIQKREIDFKIDQMYQGILHPYQANERINQTKARKLCHNFELHVST